MNYDDFIDRVNEKLRDVEAWPVSTSATSEQVYMSWVAALSVGSKLPISKFSSFTTSELTGTQVSGRLQEYPLPSDVFEYRTDFGIRSVKLDDISKSLAGAEPYPSLANLASNDLHRETKLFHMDFEQRLIFAINTGTLEIDYLPVFEQPDTGDISSTAYPLDGTHAERAASLIAYHVLGETIRDAAGAQFQGILTQEYSDLQPDPEAEPEPAN